MDQQLPRHTCGPETGIVFVFEKVLTNKGISFQKEVEKEDERNSVRCSEWGPGGLMSEV